jgi:transcriptional regulator with XRE-family HTH domain
LKIYTYEGKANISGDRIHQARTAQRLSQDALAAKLQVAGLGIGREAISRIETGLRFVTDYELVIFARVLGVPLNGSPAICRIEKGLHKNVLAFIFLPSTAPRRAAPPRLSRFCTAPAFPLLRRLRLSRACHQARAPALISAQFYFFDPPLLFPPGPRGSEKTPSYLPNFCALEPAKLNVRARSTYRARAGAGAYRRV